MGRLLSQLDSLSFSAVDGQGNLYVGDCCFSIVKFDSQGRFLAQLSGYGQFGGPSGVAVDSKGNIYVTESGNHRIQQLDSTGRILSQFGSEGSGQGQFQSPSRVAVDGFGHLYVADYGNHRIQQFFTSGSYLPYSFQVGEYALNATPYGQANAQGKQGLARTVHFRVVNSASTARTSVVEVATSLEVAVSPNPFSEQFYAVIRSTLSQPMVVRCYDAQGRQVGRGYELQLEAGQAQGLEVDGRSWPDGLYFLRVSTRQGQLVKKVVLQRK